MLTRSNASAHTVRAYRGDLLQFTAHCDGELVDLTADPIRAFLADISELSAATSKRKRAAVSSFCRWAVRQGGLDTNPIDKIDTIKVPKILPCPGPPRPTTSPRSWARSAADGRAKTSPSTGSATANLQPQPR